MAKTHFIWNSVTDNVLMETDGAGTVQATYTQEPGLYGSVVSQKRGNDTSYYHFDGQGSTRQLTDENQDVTDSATYTAFGEEVAKTGATENPWGYKGAQGYYVNPATNDLYVRARTLSPVLGRWLSVDPIFSSVNFYIYAESNPILVSDPSGMSALVGHSKDGAPIYAIEMSDVPFPFSSDQVGKCWSPNPAPKGVCRGGKIVRCPNFEMVEDTGGQISLVPIVAPVEEVVRTSPKLKPWPAPIAAVGTFITIALWPKEMGDSEYRPPRPPVDVPRYPRPRAQCRERHPHWLACPINRSPYAEVVAHGYLATSCPQVPGLTVRDCTVIPNIRPACDEGGGQQEHCFLVDSSGTIPDAEQFRVSVRCCNCCTRGHISYESRHCSDPHWSQGNRPPQC